MALQDPRAAALLPGMDAEERMASWHLVDPGGGVTSGGAAAPALLRLLPGGGAPARLASRFIGLVERGYDWVNAHRGTLGRMLTAGAVSRADRVIARRSGQ